MGQFDKHEGVSGETMNRLTKERGGEGAVAHGCMSGCIIRCSGLFPDKQGKFQSKWPEYETLWSFGPHSGISDIDAVSRFDYMCDDIGVDTIDVGVAVGVAMAGGGIPYGDAEAVKIYADAYSRNQELFEFMRSMDAYKNSMSSGDDLLVLEPNTEFFKFFNNDNGSNNP